MRSFPFYKQLDRMDCGPTCLRMIAKYYGKLFTLNFLRQKTYASRLGVSLFQLSKAATEIGFRTLYAKVDFEELRSAVLPAIVHWRGHHFVVIYKITRTKVIVGDPAIGILRYSYEEFMDGWTNGEGGAGIVLQVEPTPQLFIELEEQSKLIGFRFFLYYLIPFRRYYLQLILGMIAGLGFSVILPFLTQSVIDVGIGNKDIGFIQLVLIAQLTFSVCSTALSFIRGWIFLHIGSRINIAIISDYLIKLLKLPVSFFENKMIGDILQRIGDHSRIQNFVSATTLGTLFSFVNFFVFAGIMAYYSLTILLIFIFFSLLYGLWVIVFLKKRKEFDYRFFERNSLKQNALIQLIYGVRDIKLHNYEDKKRWEWESIQLQTFKISIKQLALSQRQQAGAFLIESTKSILISFLSARAVINGEMSLGMMLSMQYILAQVGGPISQFIGLINSYQDAKISLERISEIHLNENEENSDTLYVKELPESTAITFEKVCFSYNGSPDDLVLSEASFTIPENKVTAIVGASGSGKTTILKLLLKFYSPVKGKIRVGDTDLKFISPRTWRDNCGAVLQDGFVFSDTIAENIALGDEEVTLRKIEKAAKLANIHEFIQSLPMSYNTKIGSDGIGVSQGQRQRLLIARAVYNNPHFILFDEATNALDTKNETEILENLKDYFSGRTVVVVAHRLSTIIGADNIIVLSNGKVAESGTHDELMRNKAEYYTLIQKQTQLFHA